MDWTTAPTFSSINEIEVIEHQPVRWDSIVGVVNVKTPIYDPPINILVEDVEDRSVPNIIEEDGHPIFNYFTVEYQYTPVSA